MRATVRLLPTVLFLCVPSLAWAGGTAVVAPLVPAGVDSKVTNNLTSLISSELDFSGTYDTVNEISAPSSLNSSCLSSTSCLGAIAKANDADTVITGSVAPGGAGLKINLVLYDTKKNSIVRKKQYDMASDVAALASAAPKMVKEITGQGAAAAAAEEEAGVKEAAFEDEEDFDFDAQKSDVKGKTKFTPDTKKGKLEDVDDEEEARVAAAEAKAKAKAEADARAKAEAVAKAKAEADAKARAEAEAKAKAEAAAKAKAEAEARAKAEAAAKAKADAQAKADAEAAAKAAKSKKAPTTEEEDLEAELASFSFGGGGKVAADAEVEAEEEEEVADTRTFSERHASSAPTKAPPKTTASKAKVVEVDEEEEPEEELEEEEEEDVPRFSSKKVVKEEEEEEEEEEEDVPRFSTKKVSHDDDEEEEEEAPAPRKKVVVEDEEEDDEDEEEDAPRSSSRTRASDDEDEEEAPRASSRRASSDDEDDYEGPSSRARVGQAAKAQFGIAARGGYARYGNLDFVTYGVEMNIPVAERVVILLGVEGASTNRHYTDEERQIIADSAGIQAEQVQDWNAILPIDLGVVYKVPVSRVQPYIGADLLAVAYTSNPDFAFGGRLRGGCDFLVSDNFGFNLDLGLGVLSGSQFDLIQKDLEDTGFYPEVSGGTVLTF